ncbi:uncharacterized protein PHALS_13361 [Plasmopara halstedii]|uniref:Uncharacterized protein n=1 Tax=Plasmopara halstedii TaxID=4781 RepID=A0A0P1ANR6_PLAHL|nr:uncharacterized protein PHALS_13361 [Plasmopara halstedii]CEG43146.1 hypothetical protein PHALS_13361 [Plasmopara halstedii]|eukprot:XP_024579515.1 hypothetical protein PHALS_13361 [Plasmopara halstedii]
MIESDNNSKFAVEVRVLREQLQARDTEVTLLLEQVAALTTQLHETSGELECRMTFVADAVTRIDDLESQVAEAKRGLLTHEMQLFEGRQRETALETLLSGKEKQAEHWESEIHRKESELEVQKAAEREFKLLVEMKNNDVLAWKAKAQAVMTVVDELKSHITNARTKKREVIATLRQQIGSWKARVAKRELTIESLQRRCQDLERVVDRIERERTLEQDAHEKNKLAYDQQALIVVLREKVEKAKKKEQLLQTKIIRLREEVLLSESQRETDHRRQEQLVEGKEKEVAFLWQKYVESLKITA